MLKLANNAKSRLASSITSSTTTLTVLTGEGARFPTLGAGEWFPLTLVKTSGSLEIVKCTARATDTFTIERGQEGTTPLAFDAGDRVELRATKAVFDDFLVKSGGTATNITFDGSITEEVFALTGTTPVLEPDNGTIQTWTLTAASSPTDGLATGQSLVLMVDGAGFAVTWPSVTWKTNEGAAPELVSGTPIAIVLWKIGTTLYGARVGDA